MCVYMINVHIYIYDKHMYVYTYKYDKYMYIYVYIHIYDKFSVLVIEKPRINSSVFLLFLKPAYKIE